MSKQTLRRYGIALSVYWTVMFLVVLFSILTNSPLNTLWATVPGWVASAYYTYRVWRADEIQSYVDDLTVKKPKDEAWPSIHRILEDNSMKEIADIEDQAFMVHIDYIMLERKKETMKTWVKVMLVVMLIGLLTVAGYTISVFEGMGR